MAFVDRVTADGWMLGQPLDLCLPHGMRNVLVEAPLPLLDGDVRVGHVSAAWVYGRAVLALGMVNHLYQGDYGAEIGLEEGSWELADGVLVIRDWRLSYVRLGPRPAWPQTWVRVAP